MATYYSRVRLILARSVEVAILRPLKDVCVVTLEQLVSRRCCKVMSLDEVKAELQALCQAYSGLDDSEAA